MQVLADHHVLYFDDDGTTKRPVIPYDRIRLDVEVAGDRTESQAFA